jgi:hypothetical protein
MDELGQPINVELIAHSKSRDKIYDELKETKEKYPYLFLEKYRLFHFYPLIFPKAYGKKRRINSTKISVP